MKKIHLVSHMHWDPAWYLPYEQYRITLIPIMKRLLDTLENNEDFSSFMFDGQVDALDDYLLLYPEDRPRVEKLVTAGRLVIGPWYIQPEEFLVSGETHIRNMLVGIKKARAYGGCMPVSYLCDMVGHIPQMPQLVKGFGMDYFVGWRGILDGKERFEAAYNWEAPDGTAVLMKSLTNGYYYPMPDDPAGFSKRMDEVHTLLEPHEKSDHILLLQGADHTPAPPNTPELIRAYNEEKGETVVEQVTLEEHMRSLDPAACKTIRGELRSAWYPHSFILTGILTARMSIKYKNEFVSRELERWAEPFAAANAWVNGAEYPKRLLDYAWVKQLKNSFHDCIYGGHVDSVTEDIFSDYKKTLEITDWINGESLFALSKAIRTVGEGDNITVFNPSQWERTNHTVDFDYLVEEDRPGFEFAVFTEDSTLLPVQVNSVEQSVKSYAGFSGNQWKQCDATVYNKYALSVQVPSIPGFGYVNLGIRRVRAKGQNAEEYIRIRKQTAGKTDLTCSGSTCENAFLRLTQEADGGFSVLDKTTGVFYHNIHRIEESGDKGDLYGYSAPYSDRTYYDNAAETTTYIGEHGPNKVTFVTERKWMLPEEVIDRSRRSDRLVCNTIKIYCTLHANSKTVEFRTEIDNRSKDHRYRLSLPTGIAGKEIRSGSQFYVNNRLREPELPDSYIEQPMNNQPQRLFTDISDENHGIALFSRGISEYDARENGDVYFTLLRCVGHLSKDTNGERSYCNAGPEYATPTAQELGPHTVEYALHFHNGSDDFSVLRACDEFYAGLRCMQGDKYEGALPPSASYLQLSGDGLLLSAVKRAERENEWIVRVYNTGSEECTGSVTFLQAIEEIYKTNLNEEHEELLPFTGNTVHFAAGAHKIVTLAVRFKEEITTK